MILMATCVFGNQAGCLTKTTPMLWYGINLLDTVQSTKVPHHIALHCMNVICEHPSCLSFTLWERRGASYGVK